MRCRPGDHVVNAHAVETAFLEFDHPGVEQALDGRSALGAQFPVTSGNTASV